MIGASPDATLPLPAAGGSRHVFHAAHGKSAAPSRPARSEPLRKAIAEDEPVIRGRVARPRLRACGALAVSALLHGALLWHMPAMPPSRMIESAIGLHRAVPLQVRLAPSRSIALPAPPGAPAPGVKRMKPPVPMPRRPARIEPALRIAPSHWERPAAPTLLAPASAAAVPVSAGASVPSVAPVPALAVSAIQPAAAAASVPSTGPVSPPSARATHDSPSAGTANAASSRAPGVVPRAVPASYGRTPEPIYPESSREEGEEGLVVVRVRISSGGIPLEVRLHRSSGFRSLDLAAIAGVKRWTFLPARRGSQGVESWMDVPIRFRLGSP